VTALGHSVTEAQRAAYRMITSLQFDDMYYRKDIGYRAIAREAG